MRRIISLLSFLLIASSCSREDEATGVDSLTLYWDSRNYDGQKELFFEFYSTLPELYDLHFDYSVDTHEIRIELVEIEYQSDCPDPNQTINPSEYNCYSTGRFSIPDTLIQRGTYDFLVKTDRFSVVSEFSYQDSTFRLTIPSNNHFSSSKEVEVSVW